MGLIRAVNEDAYLHIKKGKITVQTINSGKTLLGQYIVQDTFHNFEGNYIIPHNIGQLNRNLYLKICRDGINTNINLLTADVEPIDTKKIDAHLHNKAVINTVELRKVAGELTKIDSKITMIPYEKGCKIIYHDGYCENNLTLARLIEGDEVPIKIDLHKIRRILNNLPHEKTIPIKYSLDTPVKIMLMETPKRNLSVYLVQEIE